MSPDTDPSLLQDFLVESAELIQQLDADLVKLEGAPTPGGPEAKELLSGVFRALHTIKGAAGFLGLTTVIAFAHAAEDALNRLRKGEVAVSEGVMDALLRSVDVLRSMVGDLSAGRDAGACPPELMEQLHAIGAGPAGPKQESKKAGKQEIEPEQESRKTGEQEIGPPSGGGAAAASGGAAGGPVRRALDLPPQKLDLLSFMATDMREAAAQLRPCLAQAANVARRADAAAHLGEIAGALGKTAEFFELSSTQAIADLLARVAGRLADVPDVNLPMLLGHLDGLLGLLDEQAAALEQKQAIIWPLAGRIAEVEALLETPPPEAAVPVTSGAGPTESAPSPEIDRRESERRQGERRTSAPGSATGSAQGGGASGGATTGAEATIRVEVGRLEALLNLVGQMVLNKNRFLGLGRKLRGHDLPPALLEDLGAAGNELDRLTSQLQVGVMRTRMQPLTKLFERYPRVIRDMSRALNKKINLELEGGDTEVDKSVLELLADPLVHLLRNSADHGIEPPDKRLAAGKSESGTIRLSAAHQGSHVRVEIRDDGKGIDAHAVSKKALEKGLTTPEKLAALAESDIYQFIFAPGLSTSEQVTDFSGRGVGMDVVHTNIAKMNGVVNVSSARGQGTSIEILIPLTVAIMPAMVVGVGRQVYCVPLQSIHEIVKPEDSAVHYVGGQPVMRLRDSLLALIDLRSRLRETTEGKGQFAVVVGVGGQRAGLRVDRLIGQQEIVIKPLDDKTTQGGPFSGATILEDGSVSLILDVVQLVRQASTSASGGTTPGPLEHKAA